MPKLRELGALNTAGFDDMIDSDERLDSCLLDSLTQNAWCPDLQAIHLDGVPVTSAELVTLVHKRGLAGNPLKKLVIKGPAMERPECERLTGILDYRHYTRDFHTSQKGPVADSCKCDADQ